MSKQSVVDGLNLKGENVGLFSRFFGYRWSLYVVRDGNQLMYAMNQHSAIRMTGYVMKYFADGGKPVEPWSLHLNFNRNHQSFELNSDHFSPDGETASKLLIEKIRSIDPGSMVKGAEPEFVAARTKKRLKISNYTPGNIDFQKAFEACGDPQNVTFYDIMNEVFGLGIDEDD